VYAEQILQKSGALPCTRRS